LTISAHDALTKPAGPRRVREVIVLEKAVSRVPAPAA